MYNFVVMIHPPYNMMFCCAIYHHASIMIITMQGCTPLVDLMKVFGLF